MTTCSGNGIVDVSQQSSNEEEFDQDDGQRTEEIFDKKLDIDTSEKFNIDIAEKLEKDKAENRNLETSTEPFYTFTSAPSSGQAPNTATLDASCEISGVKSDKITLKTLDGQTLQMSSKPMLAESSKVTLETTKGPTRKLGTVNEQNFMTSVCQQLTTTKEDLIKTFDADATSKHIPVAVLGIGEQINSSYDIVDLDELDEDEIRSEDQYCESDEDEEYNYPMGLRLGPIGQDREDEDKEGWNYEKEDGRKSLNYEDEDAEKVREKMRRMEAEQEELSGSLQALTSHFARLQLRLQQVTAAPEEQREELLNDLLKFSNLGIPDFRAASLQEPEKESSLSEERRSRTDQGRILEDQRRIEADAISTLKVKLEELESYAYQAGEANLPSSLVLQRQSVVLEQLKERLNIDVSDIARLSEDELKAEVDSKLCQFVNPLRMKSQLVSQLQTQIQDLEMFIHFIQEEPATVEEPICGCDTHCGPRVPGEGRRKGDGKKRGEGRGTRMMGSERVRKIEEQKQTLNLLKKAVSVLQMTSTVTSLGCGSQKFKSNTLKGESGHYGDLRAKLELAVEHLLDICCDTDSCTKEEPGGGDDIPLDTELLARSPQLTGLVRRELVPALRDLLHHGLGQKSGRGSLLPFSGCMSGRTSTNTGIVHVWDVITRFYELKGGAEFNSAPARRLSRSFGLDLAPTVSNNKQVLLQTIGQILSSHSQYRRTPDQHFKAFVSAGLNKRKLVSWLRLILRNQTILETMYQPSSYVVTTGFDDGFHLLERLSLYVFNLPVNLAVKQFQDMDEAF